MIRASSCTALLPLFAYYEYEHVLDWLAVMHVTSVMRDAGIQSFPMFPHDAGAVD
jgi:hypothetical protein